jgi:Protein of unknown function (DUF1566)
MMKATKTWVIIVLLLIPAINIHAWPIPDTGQTKCYNQTVEIPCPTPGNPFYGQDGSYNINPPSYTKLDNNGIALPNSAITWAMVKDNVTGLIWENKTDDGGIHDKDNTYTWCDTNSETNGGNPGVCGGGGTPTDTEAFIQALNAAKYGGYSNWRVPTVKELRSIVDFSQTNPSIDTTFFPGTVSSDYWSSSTYAFYRDLAWIVQFNDDQFGYENKSHSYYVRAVRGEQSGSSNHFVDNGNGTVTDTSTGLMWQKAALSSPLKWEAALKYAEDLSLAGYDDWRMPTAKELQSMVDYSKWNPAIDETFFPGTLSNHYWSSTTYAYGTSIAWRVYFSLGNVGSEYKSSTSYVRAVRAGQSFPQKKVGLPWLILLLGN